jgi:Cdc6-like AAA superfamily ATPase
MAHSPTDDLDYLDRQITRILLRAAEDPGDVRRLLERLAATLELAGRRFRRRVTESWSGGRRRGSDLDAFGGDGSGRF